MLPHSPHKLSSNPFLQEIAQEGGHVYRWDYWFENQIIKLQYINLFQVNMSCMFSLPTHPSKALHSVSSPSIECDQLIIIRSLCLEMEPGLVRSTGRVNSLWMAHLPDQVGWNILERFTSFMFIYWVENRLYLSWSNFSSLQFNSFMMIHNLYEW